MSKDKEVEVVDSREVEVDLMVKVVDLTILCRIKKNLNGRMRTKRRPSGKVVAHTEEVLDLIKEEVILIIEVVFMVIVTNLKGQASLWWEHLQIDRQRKAKQKIKT